MCLAKFDDRQSVQHGASRTTSRLVLWSSLIISLLEVQKRRRG
jgi:hypothetical protein